MITQLLRHVPSSTYDTGVKRNIFRRTIYPPSLVVMALYSRSSGGKGGGGGRNLESESSYGILTCLQVHQVYVGRKR